MNEEVSRKLELIRQTISETEAGGVRLRGTDWFAWATAGASHTVLLTAETGVAEVLVTGQDAWILTDEIEAQRLKDEELPSNFKLQVSPWAEPDTRESFVRDATAGGIVLSDVCDNAKRDRPTAQEQPVPPSLVAYKRVLMPTELERYRQVGQKASAAMTEVLQAAQPTWTEYQLAGAGAEALWARGLHPAVTLVAGERRLPLYRHATATAEKLGRQAMLVFCARGYGLFANLTRFVCFGELSQDEAELHRHVREIEAKVLSASQPGMTLDAVYYALAQAYERHGFPDAIRQHHQGGTTGYLAREVVATPHTTESLTENKAIAWNPSLPGAKVEDTFVILKDGKLENLTFDPNFPSVEVEGRLRAVPLKR
ncbi:M24 family metallopeptidase [Nostoc sp. FACHB-152]|uniref:M24 family metallopeptidase n=1 Tax=unclassified Nostoc TaxID=2593658 RepID=UPI0016834537|nr:MULTISPECIES: M24 family metallopeptidase [unclassified Nostoc]MBD2448115.1 M24 family metallopeptidase [Nostoc sp. FACHB-152]MBD2467137.1 M24 family metallopeptidase [Nostoc sp. FACHB-145]